MTQKLDYTNLAIYYLGHSGFVIHRGKHKIVIDPFLTNAPMARLKPNQISATDILITHGKSVKITKPKSLPFGKWRNGAKSKEQKPCPFLSE